MYVLLIPSSNTTNLICDSFMSIFIFVASRWGPQYYYKIKAWYYQQGPPKAIRPSPPDAQRALNLLTITVIVALINTLPYFAPLEIFSLTQSRLQIPTDVLSTRLSSLSTPPGTLSASHTSLLENLHSLESRLRYFQYGPSVMADCKFCKAEDPESYFLYAAPAILGPHILHSFVLLLCTSGYFAGLEARRFRTAAIYAAITFAAVELLLTRSYNHQTNALATRISEVYPFFWRWRVIRSVGFAAISTVFGFLLYLKSTHRNFVEPPPAYIAADNASQRLHGLRAKIGTLSILRNTINRDSGLRSLYNECWANESRVISEVMEDREVLESINRASELRLDQSKMEVNAAALIDTIFGGIPDHR